MMTGINLFTILVIKTNVSVKADESNNIFVKQFDDNHHNDHMKNTIII